MRIVIDSSLLLCYTIDIERKEIMVDEITCGKCGYTGYLNSGFYLTNVDRYGGAAIICNNCKAQLLFEWPAYLDVKALMKDTYKRDWM